MMRKFIKKIYKKNSLYINTLVYNRTKIRNLIILPNNVGKNFYVHNGKSYAKILITKEMIGYKFGEFVKTRKAFFFSNR